MYLVGLVVGLVGLVVGLVGLVVSIAAFQAVNPGSIPIMPNLNYLIMIIN